MRNLDSQDGWCWVLHTFYRPELTLSPGHPVEGSEGMWGSVQAELPAIVCTVNLAPPQHTHTFLKSEVRRSLWAEMRQSSLWAEMRQSRGGCTVGDSNQCDRKISRANPFNFVGLTVSDSSLPSQLYFGFYQNSSPNRDSKHQTLLRTLPEKTEGPGSSLYLASGDNATDLTPGPLGTAKPLPSTPRPCEVWGILSLL